MLPDVGPPPQPGALNLGLLLLLLLLDGWQDAVLVAQGGAGILTQEGGAAATVVAELEGVAVGGGRNQRPGVKERGPELPLYTTVEYTHNDTPSGAEQKVPGAYLGPVPNCVWCVESERLSRVPMLCAALPFKRPPLLLAAAAAAAAAHAFL